MTLLSIFLSIAVASPPPTSASVDLDGDGRGEEVLTKNEQTHIGKYAIECWSESGACDVYQVDITSANKQKDAMVCHFGPRDDRYCELFTLVGGELKKVPFGEESYADKLVLTGSGFMYATSTVHRLFEKTTKYRYVEDKMVQVPQPIYSAPTVATMDVNRTFKLHLQPNSSELVGNTRANSTISIVGEHGSMPGWLLVRLSSGITGWVEQQTLAEVSDEYRSRLNAG